MNALVSITDLLKKKLDPNFWMVL